MSTTTYLDIIPDDITRLIYLMKDKMETDDIVKAENDLFEAYAHLEQVGYRDYGYVDNCNDYIQEQSEIVDAIEEHLGIKIHNINTINNPGTDAILTGLLDDFEYRCQEWLSNEHQWDVACNKARIVESMCINFLDVYKKTVKGLNRKETGFIAFSTVHFSMVKRIVNTDLNNNKEMYENLDERQILRSPFVAPSTIMLLELSKMWNSLSCEDQDGWNKKAAITNNFKKINFGFSRLFSQNKFDFCLKLFR